MKSIIINILLIVCLSTLVSASDADGGSDYQIDSLLNLLEMQKESNDLDLLYQIHYDIAMMYVEVKNEEYEKAEHHFLKAYDIAKEQNDIKKIAECMYRIGVTIQKRNNFQEALEWYTAIIELNKEHNQEQYDNVKQAAAFTQISSIYQALGNHEKAFENQMQALHLSELKDDSIGIANSEYNIGTIFYYQTRYERAQKHYKKAYAICVALKDEKYMYSCLAALGSVNEKLGNHEKSLEYNTQSFEIAKKLNYKTGIAYALGNIAMNYAAQKDFVKGEQYLKESINLKLEVGDKWGVIGSKIDLSKLYIQWDKPKKALPVLKPALKMAIEVNSKTRQLSIYKNMAAVYDQLNNPITAYAFTKKYLELKDSVLNEKTVEEMGQTKRRYEIVQKEHEIALLTKENELFGKNEKIQQLQIYIFAIAGLLFLSFIWWYRSKLNYQNNMNKLLGEKNEILNEKNDEINVKNKQLEHSNESLEQFAYVASHDLKEPLRMISSFSSLLERRYKQQIDDTGKEFIHYITDAVSRMETLLDDLLNFSRAGNKSSPAQVIEMSDIMLTVESNLRTRFESLNGTLIVQKENLPTIKAHRTQLIQLLQNLVSNGVKFKGERDPVVIVDCESKDDKYIFSVKDNGIGISKENLEKVFEMFRRLNTRENYEGTGIGLATCKKIVSSWGGDIWIESTEGEGSTFFFNFPCQVEEPVLV